MRLRIGHKLFLAFVLTIGVVVAILVATQRYSFQRGFLDYVKATDRAMLEALATELEQDYAEQGSWQFIAGTRRWPRHLLGAMHSQGQDPEVRMRGARPPDSLRHREHAPWQRAHGPTPLPARIGLYDVDGQWLAGARVEDREPVQRSLHADGAVIGQLLMVPLHSLSSALDLQFAYQQRHELYMAAIAMFIVAALASVVLARSLGAPIRALTRGTHALASGHYDTRIRLARRDELGRLAEDFNTLAQALQRNREAQRDWIADISHELRTPIAILKGELEALEDGVRTLDPAALHSLAAEVQRLGSLVDDLYELTRADSGALSYSKRVVDLSDLLEDTVASFRVRAAAASLDLDLDGAAPSVTVFADPERLRQLFTNLLENALRYNDAGGRVRVTHERRDASVRITVEDSPPGVPDEALPRLFERLYRVDPSRSRDTGAAGLGLAICASIVNAHSGTISARHSSLGGVAIVVDLPVHSGD